MEKHGSNPHCHFPIIDFYFTSKCASLLGSIVVNLVYTTLRTICLWIQGNEETERKTLKPIIPFRGFKKEIYN